MITDATIYASNYEETLEFYKRLFKNKLTETDAEQFQLDLQWNTLKVIKEKTDEKPYYHFCFLIPKPLFKHAKEYVSKLVSLNTKDGADEITFTDEIQSFYFYDPSGNVAEFMGKESVDEPTDTTFSPEEVLALSEMSLVTEQIENTAAKLHKEGLLSKTPEEVGKNGLTFIPSGETTLLLSTTDRTWLFSDKYPKVFPQKINIDSRQIVVTPDKEIQIS